VSASWLTARKSPTEIPKDMGYISNYYARGIDICMSQLHCKYTTDGGPGQQACVLWLLHASEDSAGTASAGMKELYINFLVLFFEIIH